MVAVFKSFDHDKIESLKDLHSYWSEFIYEREGEYDEIQLQEWTKERDALGKAIGLIEQKPYMAEFQKFDIPEKNINYWLGQLVGERHQVEYEPFPNKKCSLKVSRSNISSDNDFHR
jgi:hypothetical protein